MILGVALLAGCYNDSKEELYPVSTPSTGGGTGCDTANVTFTASVLPIFTANCATSGCHTAATRAGNYDLSTYAGAKAAVDAGRLLGAVKQLTGFSQMPQGKSKLDDCSIAKIDKWVALGAQNN